jgi:hypothetical protein
MDNIEVEFTKHGYPVPINNGVYLHSIFDPQKEAKTFVDSQLERINKSDSILVLGLAFGYHIDAIFNYLNENEIDKEVCVLEPSKDLIKKYEEFPNTLDRVKVFNPLSIKQLFEDFDFVEFLMNKPAILIHSNSFNQNKAFYKYFLNFTANIKPDEYKHLVNGELSQKFNDPSVNNFEELIGKINNPNRHFDKNDFLLMAFNELK